MRRGGLSELSSTNMLVVFLIIGLIFLSQAITQQIQKVTDLLSQAEAATQPEVLGAEASDRSMTGGIVTNAYDG